jgi:hypothetical protein
MNILADGTAQLAYSYLPTVSLGRDKVERAESNIAGIERDAQVIQAISKTLSNLEMVNELAASVVAQGSTYRLDFTSEIDRLSGVLRMMGARRACVAENASVP